MPTNQNWRDLFLMKPDVRRTIDDMVFEHRNKDYGSYRLRKQYYLRLAIGFLVSLSVMAVLVFSYSWYLNSAGDETVFLYPSANPTLKTTRGSLMSPQEISSYMRNSASPDEQKVDQNNKQQTDELHNFKIVESATPDTFRPKEEIDPPADMNTGTEFSEDSSIFGGFLPGEGEGVGGENEIDRYPVFPGGSVQRYIESVLNYPPQAIKQKIHGRVLLSFVVNKTGEVVNIKVEKGVNPLLDAEAMKAIESLPRWKPGLRHGRPISIQLLIPVNFIPLN
jgi:TonB family protein